MREIGARCAERLRTTQQLHLTHARAQMQTHSCKQPPTYTPPRAGGAALTVDAVLSVAGDQVAEQIDAREGGQVTDQSIYRAHAAKYEVRGGCVSWELGVGLPEGVREE